MPERPDGVTFPPAKAARFRHAYWLADSYARQARERFEEAAAAEDATAIRAVFFAAATMYRRTLAIFAAAVARPNPELARVAAGNLLPLHAALAGMHQGAPLLLPAPLTVHDPLRVRFVQDLLVSALAGAGRPLPAAELEARVEESLLIGDLGARALERALAGLLEQGVLIHEQGRYSRAGASYEPLNLDREALHALLPAALCARLRERDFHGIGDVAARARHFLEEANAVLNWGPELAVAFARACRALAAYDDRFPTLLPHADLLRSSLPRPYQYEAFAVFQGHGYNGQVVEAPTGSGKTLIGMLCIQDWLAGLAAHERILVLVPTQNYQRQWVRELCFLPTGLNLPPDAVWAGTPRVLAERLGRGAPVPPVLVMTYPALAGIVAAGDDPTTVEPDALAAWMRAFAIQHVILDEVHKVAQEMESPSARLARALADWNRTGNLRDLIGFSGTAAAYEQRLAALGLDLVHRVPELELIAYGFVAPFAELAVPFAYSEREKAIHETLARYKERLRAFYASVGGPALRARWAALPLARRLEAARALGLGSGGAGETALTLRLAAAGHGEAPVALTESWMVALLQALEGTGDEALAAGAADPAAAAACLAECRGLAGDLAGRIGVPSLAARLAALAGAGSRAPELPALSSPGSVAARRQRLRDALAVTAAGVALSIPEWYRQAGEGRVGTIRAVLDAERGLRTVPAAILFDTGRPIPWHQPTPAPGYGGVGGTFAELLREQLPGVTPMAALSEEFYLPLEPPGLPDRVAGFIRDRIMVHELGDELVEMATQGLSVPAAASERLRSLMREQLAGYAAGVQGGRGRVGEFRRRVLTPVRRSLRGLGLAGLRARVAERLTARNPHLASLARAFYDHAAVAALFRGAVPRRWVGTDGRERRCAVIELPPGPRRQLMFEMTSRIIDAPELPINLIIVSPWARTGWNVRCPNLMIDATATRNRTAWQQLRGRAMRALPGWTATCARAVTLLIGHDGPRLDAREELPADVYEAFRALPALAAGEGVDRSVLALLATVLQTGEETRWTAITSGRLGDLSAAQRLELITRLMRRYNKVTHIYELVKAYGESQVVKEKGTWRRRPAIESKHAGEESVNPLDGRHSRGAGHAPLLYAQDPRADLPAALRDHLATVLAGADDRIVSGWVQAVAGEDS
jgi:hypothetical protein